MKDPSEIRALKALGDQLEHASLEGPTPRGPRFRIAFAATAVAVTVAVPALAASEVFDFGGNTPRAGEPGGPPAVVRSPTVPTVNVIATLYEPGGERLLRDRVEPYGFSVRIERRPVGADAVGRVLGVQFPRRARFDSKNDLVLDPQSNGTISVLLGRAAVAGDASSETSGLSLYEVLPRVKAAISRDDPRLTLDRLRDMGFRVAVKLVVDNPDRSAPATTGSKNIAEPPEGTVVLSVLSADGSSHASRRTRSLLMEVAPQGSDVARDHP